MSCNFRFEDVDYTYPTGYAKVTKRLRIQKTHEDGTVETYRVELVKAPQEHEVFFKHPRTGSIEKIHEHLAPLLPTFKEYYEVHQSFSQPACNDPLGGFCSGKTWELPVPEAKMLEVLMDFCKKSYKQVPYVRRVE